MLPASRLQGSKGSLPRSLLLFAFRLALLRACISQVSRKLVVHRLG